MNILRGKNLADNMLQRVKTDISNELFAVPVRSSHLIFP